MKIDQPKLAANFSPVDGNLGVHLFFLDCATFGLPDGLCVGKFVY